MVGINPNISVITLNVNSETWQLKDRDYQNRFLKTFIELCTIYKKLTLNIMI